jgi:putative tryptophan/tyrosine transport system substrate-binding protein
MPVIIRRRELIAALGGAAVWPLSVSAQEGGRKYMIGILSAGNERALNPALNAALFEALRELGWAEGKNVSFEHRYALRIGLNDCPNSQPTWSDADEC